MLLGFDSTAALLWLLGRLALCGLSAGMPPVLPSMLN
jgi:hypothetical protein